MPPKGVPESPPLARTLSAFFFKGAASNTNTITNNNTKTQVESTPGSESQPAFKAAVATSSKNPSTPAPVTALTEDVPPSSPSKAARKTKPKAPKKVKDSLSDNKSSVLTKSEEDQQPARALVTEVVIPPRGKQDSESPENDSPQESVKATKTLSPSSSSSHDNIPKTSLTVAPPTREDTKFSANAVPAPTLGVLASKVNKTDSALMLKIRSGKVSMTEPKLNFGAHPATVRQLALFHDMRESLQDENKASLDPNLCIIERVDEKTERVQIVTIPDCHLGLIAKLSEESDQSAEDLACHILSILCPVGFGEMTATTFQLPSSILGSTTDSTDQDAAMEDIESVIRERTDTTVSKTAILEALQKVVVRVNYGISPMNLPPQAYATPANLSVFRWEVAQMDMYFPPDMKAIVMKRRAKRQEFTAALTAWFIVLDQKLKDDLCPPTVDPALLHSQQQLQAEGTNNTGVSVNADGTASGTSISHTSVPRRKSLGGEAMEIELLDNHSIASTTINTSESGAIDASSNAVQAELDPMVLEAKLKEAEEKKKEAEAKEEKRLEKERKQQEKDQKEADRLAKEEAKKRKEEEERMKKQQTSQRFVGFFKPKSTATSNKENQPGTAIGDSVVPQTLLGDLFHPFHVKKNTTLAPVSRFSRNLSANFENLVLQSSNSSGTDTCQHLHNHGGSNDHDMEIDHDDEHARDLGPQCVPQLGLEQARQHFGALFAKRRTSFSVSPSDHTLERSRTLAKLPKGYRQMSVKELIHSGLLLQDRDGSSASTGAVSDAVLTSKEVPQLRMKLYQFAENYRPAYYGTWSKISKKINGRRFLVKDTKLVEYDVDSEAEWEEDEEGEECKSDDEDEDQEDANNSDNEEEDDWLVPEGYLSEDEGLDGAEGGEGRSATNMGLKKETKRPLVAAHLVPVIVGPVFEVVLGEVSNHPALEPYHVQFIGQFEPGMNCWDFKANETTASATAGGSLPSEVDAAM